MVDLIKNVTTGRPMFLYGGWVVEREREKLAVSAKYMCYEEERVLRSENRLT